MSPTETTAAVRFDTTDESGTIRVRIAGTLDADAAPVVAQEFERLFEQGHVDFVVDLDQITVISSAGVGCLIAGVGQARDEGGDARIDSMSDVARHVFDMLDLIDFFQPS